MIDICSGIQYKKFPTTNCEVLVIDSPEFYLKLIKLHQGDKLKIDGLEYASIYVPPNQSNFELNINNFNIKSGSNINIVHEDININAINSSGNCIVSGYRGVGLRGMNKISKAIVKNAQEIYTVNKPWGHELWINYKFSDNLYSFKEIFIRKGFQTSLQFHKIKKEASLFYSGACNFFYKNDNDENLSSLGSIKIDDISGITILPNSIHRIQAITNLYHYEVSTPHLDDVIRIQDDTNRASGKIDLEHLGGSY